MVMSPTYLVESVTMRWRERVCSVNAARSVAKYNCAWLGVYRGV